MYFGQTLFVTMNQDFGKIRQVFIELGKCLAVITRQDNPFPQIFGRMRSFDSFDVEMNTTGFFTNGSVFGIGEWTTCAVA